MTASELAFMALGLLLGAAVGVALFVTVASRVPRREIRVTVTRNALPRRSETLSQGAFAARPSEPARGGPGDRRWFDRDHQTPESALLVTTAVWAPETPADAPAMTPVGPGRAAPARSRDRTIVPLAAGAIASPAGVPTSASAVPALEPIVAPIEDPAIATAAAPLSRSIAASVAVGLEPEPESDTDRAPDDLRRRPARGTTLERMLRGDHMAMVEAIDAIGGEDGHRRREWEVLLGGLVEAMAEVAVEESVIDFPMGTAFWDTFTVEQCRRIVASLASMGYRYDGVDGWAEARVPAYRDLSNALADVGVEPRRVRAWPNQSEIAALFVGARPAPEELLAAAGPDYTAADMQALVGERATAIADLWVAWDSVKSVLLSEQREPAESQPVA
ncbi:MAG TPA: hypothetical protein VM451_03040 [Candidatus Limnocylindria bacterium]|nr:hypothetical protein [Candidatus Limnocylindria bacterium]